MINHTRLHTQFPTYYEQFL